MNESPLATHRFRLNEYSGGVLRIVRNELKQFKVSHPEVVGATVFGSQTRGTARREGDPRGKSDIDMCVFVDETKLSDGVKSTIDEHLTGLRNSLLENSTYPKEDYKEQKIYQISDDIIDQQINNCVSWLRAEESLDKGENHDETNKFGDVPDTYLDTLFHLQLDNGLDHYRLRVIEKLSELGDVGEKIWRDIIISNTKLLESGRISRETRLLRDANDIYPPTLASARKIYNPPAPIHRPV